MPNATPRKTLAIVILALFSIFATQAMAEQAEYVNPSIPNDDSAAYWLDQGGLLSAYGNYPAALRAYKKALDREPGLSEAHFGIGVALGAMEDFNDALARIDQAIAMDPDNDRYHYGRGWVLTLAGRRDEALTVLRKAGEMGSLDARMFLQYLENK